LGDEACEALERKCMGMTKDLILREYQTRDIPRVIDLIVNAIPQLPNYKMIKPDKGRIEYVLVHNIDNASSFAGWVLCDSHDIPQGMGGGWCVRNLMSLDYVADDIFMWVEPEYRNLNNVRLLITTYVEWAKARGAKLIRASHTGGSFPKGSKEAKLYDAMLRRFGFTEVGSVYHLNHGAK
jgi:GNAT superfamily N-acetyltransferase